MNYLKWTSTHFNKTTDWALVTGGTSGIGYEYANQICAAGCNCLLVSNEAARLPEVASELHARHGVEVLAFDATFLTIEQQRLCAPTYANEGLA